jgi:diguanylate cyclase (GGDEF)-like protein
MKEHLDGQRHRSGHQISTIRIVDSLAEITRYKDRELLERSLAATLTELFPNEEFRLCRLLEADSKIELILLIYANHGTVVCGQHSGKYKVPANLLETVLIAVESRDVAEQRDPETGLSTFVYPVYDKQDKIFSVLIHGTDHPCFETQRLTYGLLRIYSNYFSLLEASHRDKLTNLFNRETLDAAITKKIIGHAKRTQRLERGGRRSDDEWHSWLCLIDVDHFKRINDEWGHLYGDEVLILMARLLESIFRDEDLIFRYGGEEFVVLFRTRSLEDALSVCERARRTIEQHSFPGVGQVTASLGTTEILNQESTSMVIDQADQALYYAKGHGRNQVHFYEILLEQQLIEGQNAHKKQGSIDFF